VLIIVGFIAIFIVYLLSSANAQLNTLITQYTSITAKTSDSKGDFDKRLFYVTVNSDGTKTVTFGYKSEVAQEQAEQAAEEAATGEAVASGGESTGDITGGLAQSAMNFYKTVSVGKGTTTGVTVNGIALYSGLPWDASGAYELDFSKCYQYINNYLTANTRTSYAIDNNCKSSPTEVDGVQCAEFAAYPILAFCDIDEYGNPIGWSKSTRPRKVCAVLEDASGTTYYMPLTCSRTGSGNDAKGHGWPGGVSQTFLSFSGSASGWTFNSDGGYITGSIIGKTITNLSDITNGYSTVKYNGTLVTTTSPQLNIELNSAFLNALKGTYTFKGFIAWKE
jgi:hypothetical protein